MPNELKCSFCHDSLTTDDNDSNLCGACADNLKAEIAKLNKALNKAILRLALTCPPTKELENCKQPYDFDCKKCWHEFLMKEEK